MQSRRVLIAGCGYVGERLGLELARAGHRVFGLRRQVRAMPLGITPIAADLAEPASLVSLPEDVEVVFYMASPDGYSDEAYRVAYVDGLGHLLSRLTGIDRLFLVTSTGVYGQDQGEWVDETSPTQPGSFAGRRLLEAERLAARASPPVTVVRLAGIYGPGRTRLVRTVAAGRAVISSEPVFTNRIHRDDGAGLLAHLMGLAAPDPVYIGVDSAPVQRGRLLRWLADRLGVPHPPVGERSNGRRRGSNKRCRNDRLLATGYRFRYPSYREGYGALIAAGDWASEGT